MFMVGVELLPKRLILGEFRYKILQIINKIIWYKNKTVENNSAL